MPLGPLHHLPGMCEGETVVDDDDDCCAYSIAMQQHVDYPHTHTLERRPTTKSREAISLEK